MPSFASEAVWTPHKQSTQLVPGVWAGVTPFGRFADGSTEAVPSGFLEEVVDTVWGFIECCDHPQGFQCLVDDQTGFGALAAGVIQVCARRSCGGLFWGNWDDALRQAVGRAGAPP